MKTLSLFVIALISALMMTPSTLLADQVDYAEAVNKAGKQRMLSQRIAKAYLFHGQNVRTDKAKQQLSNSILEFLNNHQYLKTKIKFKGVQDMLSFVEYSIDEYHDLVTQPYSKKNATKVLDLSETLLEASQDIVVKIETLAQTKKSQVVNISGRQRMLSQRIAKFYIAYQAGFQDANSVNQLAKAVSDFEKAQERLLQDQLNTEQISNRLIRTKRLWKIVRGFFLDIERGSLPVTVFATTDAIMDNMNTITGMYVVAEGSASS